ncbi:MAG: hypothetical protein LBF19_01175 [Prevotellaceae bacterium]|nr:hypothetical protein [Prevotellaceae bacterium]
MTASQHPTVPASRPSNAEVMPYFAVSNSTPTPQLNDSHLITAGLNSCITYLYLRVADADLRVTDSNPRVADANLRVADADLRVADADLRVADANLRVADADLRVADADLRVADANQRVADADLRVMSKSFFLNYTF